MKLMGFILVSGIVIFGGLYFFSRKLLYFPVSVSNPRLEQMKTAFKGMVSEITVPIGENGLLHGWVIEKDMKNLPMVFYFGGNAEEVSLNTEDFLKELDANVVMVNYRGYGKSTGFPFEQALKSDALAVYDAVVEKYKIKPDNAVAWGRSLGSSMACFLAMKRGLGGLILTCPFDSVEAVAASYYPGWLVRLVLKDPHRTTDFSPGIKSPTLVLASRDDEVISPQNTLNLYESLTCPKQLVYIEGAGHNTISDFEPYYKAVNQFLNQIKKP